jgi:hypothetical protein
VDKYDIQDEVTTSSIPSPNCTSIPPEQCNTYHQLPWIGTPSTDCLFFAIMFNFIKRRRKVKNKSLMATMVIVIIVIITNPVYPNEKCHQVKNNEIIKINPDNGQRSISFDNGRSWKKEQSKIIKSVHTKISSEKYISYNMGRSWIKDSVQFPKIIRILPNKSRSVSYDKGIHWSLIEENAFEKELINVYPNPCKDKLFISLNPNEVSNEVYVNIINTIGNIVFSDKLTKQNQLLRVNVESYIPGTYLIKVNYNNFCITKKIVISH